MLPRPRAVPRTTNKYSDRFKAAAVRLSQLPGVEVQDVAQSLYIHPFMLSRWRKEACEGRIVTKEVLVEEDAAAELKALRRMKKQYERLKLEHEILIKPSRSLRSEERSFRVHRSPLRSVPGPSDVRAVWSERERLLRVAIAADERASR